jgi:hypothetical protein
VAAAGISNEYRSIIATERIIPVGLMMPCPAISGAEPRTD